MLYLNTRYKFTRINFIKKFINYFVVGIVSIVFIFLNIFAFLNKKDSTEILNIFAYSLIPAFCLGIFNVLVSFLTNKHLRKMFVNECLEIVNFTKMPNKLPKVVYVYTTHNDFMPGRLLQNMKQSYKNFEVWISDGSSNKQIIDEIDLFVKKYSNVHLFRMKNESKNKADNLNTFLKESGATFDYLLIADADEALHERFVEKTLPFFYSSKIDRLAYVTPLNQTYRTRSLFSNYGRFVEDFVFFNDLKSNWTLSDYPHTYGASSLFSGEFVKKVMGNQFPIGCFEDWYSENIAVRKGWAGLITPITICTQAFDSSSPALFSRLMRINDWGIKYNKEQAFKDYNEKYEKWFMKAFLILFIPLIILLIIFILSTLIWLFSYHFDFILSNKPLMFSLIVNVTLLLIGLIFLGFDKPKITITFKEKVLAPIFAFFIGLALLPRVLQHWYLAFVKSKYMEFGGSPKRFIKYGFMKNIQKIFPDIIWFIVLSVLLSTFDFTFVYYGLYLKLSYLFVIVNVVLIVFWISCISSIFLYITSQIIENKKYNPNDFIVYDNEFVQFKKIKEEFYTKNKIEDKVY